MGSAQQIAGDFREECGGGQHMFSPATSEISRFVAALVRIRGANRLDDAIISRHWLATDMGVDIERLDRVLRLLRWRGLISLPNDNLVEVRDGQSLKSIWIADQVALQNHAPHGLRPAQSVVDRGDQFHLQICI